MSGPVSDKKKSCLPEYRLDAPWNRCLSFLAQSLLFLVPFFTWKRRYNSDDEKRQIFDVTELESTHKEADNRIILHAMYFTHNENVERIIIYRSDTDGIVLAIYCAETLLNHVDELTL